LSLHIYTSAYGRNQAVISITEQELKTVAREQGYRPEILEKVYRLLDLLETFMAVPLLKEKLVLKECAQNKVYI
jgi:hypothetical protein